MGEQAQVDHNYMPCLLWDQVLIRVEPRRFITLRHCCLSVLDCVTKNVMCTKHACLCQMTRSITLGHGLSLRWPPSSHSVFPSLGATSPPGQTETWLCCTTCFNTALHKQACPQHTWKLWGVFLIRYLDCKTEQLRPTQKPPSTDTISDGLRFSARTL